ncbi:hydroxyacylglutathione hydrolase [Thiohalobacter sp. COW1]|nr:hydroxyacylglutathione hydrolase [Thiohalobacter sp. COW1]
MPSNLILNMLTITPVPAFSDNYIWFIRQAGQRQVAIVDPGDAAPVLAALQREKLEPAALLITHHHGDHVGGIRHLLEHYPGLPVYGPAGERIPQITQRLSDGDRVRVEALDTEFEVFDVPGHTAGHIAYYTDHALFCGDTLFTCGCGRVFDGSVEQLHASLQRLRRLPPETRIYCAHEYTLENIGFAKWVEPDNAALLQREREAIRTREQDRPTVPAELALELATNPFLRTDDAGVIAMAERHAGRPMRDAQDTFITLRRWKDVEYD